MVFTIWGKSPGEMTLKKEVLGGDPVWAMYTVNAAVRAHNRGFVIPKYFDSLAEGEEVQCDIETTPKGPSAVNVTLAKK